MKIDFQFTTQYGTFGDSLYLPDDHTFTEDDIQTMKQARLDNWLIAVTTPPPELEQQFIEVDGVKYIKAE